MKDFVKRNVANQNAVCWQGALYTPGTPDYVWMLMLNQNSNPLQCEYHWFKHKMGVLKLNVSSREADLLI